MARKEKIIPAWRQEKRKCAVCGRAFYPRQSVQKYCSPECCRYANRHGGRAFSGPPMISDPNKPAIRQFKCKHCGEEVRVTETNDLRTKFCSQRCENLYWKHSKRVKRGKRKRGHSAVGTAGSWWSLPIPMTAGPFSVPRNAALTGIPIRKRNWRGIRRPRKGDRSFLSGENKKETPVFL